VRAAAAESAASPDIMRRWQYSVTIRLSP
jgi:hypothetical protein